MHWFTFTMIVIGALAVSIQTVKWIGRICA